MAAPPGRTWELMWASDDPGYGGSGAALLNTQQWSVPGHAALVLRPGPVAQVQRTEAREDA
jgi:hypothetical protein